MTSASNLTWPEEERLYLLIEECGEVIQAASKILRHGYSSFHPVTQETNIAALERELGDLVFALSLLVHNGDINQETIDGHYELAVVRKEKYLHDNDIPSIMINTPP